MEFRGLTLADKDLFNKYSAGGMNFEDSFAVIYCWNAFVNYNIAEWDDGLFIRINFDGKIIFDTVKTKEKKLDKYILEADRICANEGVPLSMKILKSDYELLDDSTKNKFNFTPMPEAEDYIYKAADLATYEGRKFQKKRNLLSQFLRNYKYEFMPYDKVRHYSQILDFQTQHSEPDNHEYPALKIALDHMDELGLNCDIIEIDGRLAAFNISGGPRDNCGEMLFEKADKNYKGCYAAIVKFSSQKHFADCKYINRQEDLGMENLRKSKLSYNPIMKIEKLRISRK
jgi:hypothetical protein